MTWESIRKKFGGTSRPERPCDFVVFSLNFFQRFKLWWSDNFGYSSGAYRLHFRVWIDPEGITIGRFVLFRNSCIRVEFRKGTWSMDENGIQIESVDGNSRLILSDKRLSDVISKRDQFRAVVRASRTQTKSTHWETTRGT
jgi:hypothetical protein